jgi:hypothetical protein
MTRQKAKSKETKSAARNATTAETASPGQNAEFTKISQIAKKVFGMPGRMISMSKSLGPPTAVWNAKVLNARAKMIWSGDIDIEQNREQLLQLADQLGPLYILPESAESINEALVMVEPGEIWIDDKFVKYICVKTMRQRRRQR